MESSIPSRYEHNPMLVILENYILTAINELPAEKIRLMGEVIRKSWGGDLDWMATVRDKLQLPADIDETLRNLWERNQGSLPPEDFARMVADQHYADLTKAPE